MKTTQTKKLSTNDKNNKKTNPETNTNPKTKTKDETVVLKPDVDNTIFELAIGSYERLLYGLKLVHNPKYSISSSHLPLVLEPRYIIPVHLGMIKCVASGVGRYLASGSTDEIIKLYDLKTKKELGSLHEHKGTITSLNFHSKTHLLSSSEVGELNLWRCKDWELMSALKSPTTSKINSVSIHPSGKLCIAVTQDKLCLIFNLMTGQLASSLKLDRPAEKVQFDKLGSKYVLMDEKRVTVFNLGEEEPKFRFESEDLRVKFLDVDFDILGTTLIVATSDGGIIFFDLANTHEETKEELEENPLKTGGKSLTLKAHKVRVKSIATIQPTTTTTTLQGENKCYLTSISSDGVVLIWDLDLILHYLNHMDTNQHIVQFHHKVPVYNNKFPKDGEHDEEHDEVVDLDMQKWLVANYNAKVRFTCLTLHNPIH